VPGVAEVTNIGHELGSSRQRRPAPSGASPDTVTGARSVCSRVETVELAGPTRRHHDNTLRAWEAIPVRVRAA
jgi:hypothetical protein